MIFYCSYVHIVNTFSKADIVRVSRDKCVNSYVRELLALCKSSDLILFNGRFDQDKHIGSYTRVDTTYYPNFQY